MNKLLATLSILFLIPPFGQPSFANDKTNKNNSFLELEYPENLKIIHRADWGWKPIESSFKTHNIDYITVHHGGVEFSADKNTIEHVKNLQSWGRRDKSWVDIPYHFMIDLQGNIFEARPVNIPGDTNTEYDPTSHILVEVMGNYEIQKLSTKQFVSMTNLIKYLSNRFEVPSEKIKTHRDYANQTVCRGKNIYKYFSNGSIHKMLN